ncbi:MAG: class B sortase [Angelakisella sp.]|nr:class B sortase [Angelakisella sp.]
MDKKQKWIGVAALALVVVIVLVAFTRCGTPEPDSSSSVSQSLNEEVALPDFKGMIERAKQKNSDTKGWLYIPGTDISDVVYQTGDNEFYLRRNGDKNYSFAGSLFFDYRNKLDPLSQNTIIYGHHIGSPMGAKDDPNGDKFGQLLRFAQEDFAKKTPFVWLAIEDKVYTFEVFGVYYTEAYMIPVQYHHPSFSKDDWDMLIEDVQARSLYTYEGLTPYDTKILTLSTCSYKYGTYSQNPNQRFVVMARLTDEKPKVGQTAQFTVNPQPKEPQF